MNATPSQFYNDAIFWIEVDKISPNPYQPRREFDQHKLMDLSDSIRQYGVLQPLVVTRYEVQKEDGGLQVLYELIAGERRLRASKLAGLSMVPAIIRSSADDARMKLELAIIENLQREDLNPVDRARAFERLVAEFDFKHNEIAQKVGKSREYVSNTLRLLSLPSEILDALSAGKISEGHARPLMMLNDRPEEQLTLYKEIMVKKLTVREAEAIARRIAYEKVRKKERTFDPEIVELEEKLTESLGTRVQIERKDTGGRIMIDFFSSDDLRVILNVIEKSSERAKSPTELMEKFLASREALQNATPLVGITPTESLSEAAEAAAQPHAEMSSTTSPESSIISDAMTSVAPLTSAVPIMSAAEDQQAPVDDRSQDEKKLEEETEEDLYSVRNFTV